MTGVCGGVADGGRRAVDDLAERLRRFGDETVHRDARGDGAVSLVSHRPASQPAEAADGTLLWCWGQVYGHGADYRSRSETHPDATPAEYCRDVYDRHGFDTIATLNGEYALVALDPDGDRIRIVTDRLGTHPVYWTRTDDGDVVFCSSLQALTAHPSVSVAFDRPVLYEYFAFRRTFGLETPIEGVQLAHPGAITTIDCVTGSVETDVYWRPSHDAGSQSRSAAREDYVRRFRDAVADREAAAGTGRTAAADGSGATADPGSSDPGPSDVRSAGSRGSDAPPTTGVDPDSARATHSASADRSTTGARSGVLVSGGNDSRAIVAAMEEPPIGFHVTRDESAVETRVARQVLDAAGADVRLLHRDEDYLVEALSENAPLCDFGSWFNQAHVYDFATELRESCDLLYTGLYGDVFSGGTLPAHSLPTPLGKLPLPVLDHPETVEEYLEMYLDGTLDRHSNRLPSYCRTPPDAREILQAKLRRVPDGIDHHGVRYGDLSDLLFASIYPVTNRHSFLFYSSLCQTMPTANPHFDYRLLDWLLAQPLGRLLRLEVQNDVIRNCAPELAEIPHAARGISPRHSFPLQYASHRLQGARRRIRTRLAPSETRGVGFTTDHDEVLRSRSLVRDNVQRHRDLVERYDWLDADGIQAEYEAHCDGDSRRSELFTLLTFLEMPVHDHVAPERRRSGPPSAE